MIIKQIQMQMCIFIVCMLVAVAIPHQLLAQTPICVHQNAKTITNERHHLIIVYDNSLNVYAKECLLNTDKVYDAIKEFNKKHDILRDSSDFYSIINYAVGNEMRDFNEVARPSTRNGQSLIWQKHDNFQLISRSNAYYRDIVYFQGVNRPKTGPYSWNSGLCELALRADRIPKESKVPGCEKTYMIIVRDEVSAGGDYQNEVSQIFGLRSDEMIRNYLEIYQPIKDKYSFKKVDTKTIPLEWSHRYYIELYEVNPNGEPSFSGLINFDPAFGIRECYDGYQIDFVCDLLNPQQYRLLDATMRIGDNELIHEYANDNSIHFTTLIDNHSLSDSITLSCRALLVDTIYGGMIVSPATDRCKGLKQTLPLIKPAKATIFGIPMPRTIWWWCHDDAEMASLIWQIIIVLVLSAIIILVLRNAIKRRSTFRPNSKQISLEQAKPYPSRIHINLQSPEKTRTKIGSFIIRVQKPRSGFLNVGIKPQCQLQASIQDIKWNAKEKEINSELSKIFYIENAGGKTKYESMDLSISDYETPFSLYVNTDAIHDIQRKQDAEDREYTLSATLAIRDGRGNDYCSTPIAIQLQIDRVKPQIEAQLIFDNSKESTGIKYDAAEGRKRVGIIVISNRSKLTYCPTATVDLSVDIERNGISIGTGGDGINIQGLPCGGKAKFDLVNGQQQSFPVVVDFPVLGNPLGDADTYSIPISISSYFNGQDTDKVSLVSNPSLKILANVEEIALDVRIRCDQVEYRLMHEKKMSMPRLSFTPGGGNLRLGYHIIVGNSSRSGYSNTGVYVKGLSQTIEFYPKRDNKDAVEVVYATEGSTKEKTFAFQGNDLNSLVKGVLLPCTSGPSSHRQVHLGFNTGSIKRIQYTDNDGTRHYTMTVLHTISFLYYIDRVGKQQNADVKYETFTTAIKYEVEQLSYPEWLAVDFGTSAIVARYGSDGKVIDLRDSKDKLLKDQGLAKDCVHEIGTPFLSSNAVLRGNVLGERSRGHSQLLFDYTDASALPEIGILAVCLSASTETEDANIEFLLPTLKQLVGYELLPNLAAYQGMRYNYLDRETGTLVERGRVYDPSTNVHTPLAQVSTILTEIYAQLFQYYIKRSLGANILEKVNKIVLTIPNTFTPHHIQIVKEVVLQSTKQLDVREIRFVSESDAVACYYVANHQSLRMNNFNGEKEHILVYDMGAGTLDLSYFSRTIQPDGTYELQSLGRIGISKAGNYLDALLADCLAKHYPRMRHLTSDAALESADEIYPARRLKDFIKDTVKTKLGIEKYQLPVEADKAKLLYMQKDNKPTDVSLDLEKIFTNTKQYQEYIQDCTKGIVEKLFKLAEIDKPRVDTLIISGRSAQLNGISENLFEALKDWGINLDSLEVINLCQSKDKHLSKTVVAQGAEIFARLSSNNLENDAIHMKGRYISARYGIIYDSADGVTYTELLNPYEEQPTEENYVEGILVQTYSPKPQTIDLRWAKEIILVQTYSDNTALDWKRGRTEYISEMARYNVQAIPSLSKARVQLTVDSDGQMKISIPGMGDDAMNPTRVDVQSEDNRKSLWPMLNVKN